MRYCINCGSPMDDERFCNQCGADNGEEYKKKNQTAASLNIPKIDLSFVLHLVSVVLFVVAAVILLAACCGEAEITSADSVLYTGSVLFVIVYFVIGMWSCVPALLFILNIRSKKSAPVVGAAAVMLIIMIVVCLVSVIFENSKGVMKFFSIMAETYKAKAVTVIILESVTALLGVVAPRITK